MKKPFENKDDEANLYLNINRVLAVGSRRYLTKKDKKTNCDEKKSILFSLALRGILILKKRGVLLPPNCANSIENIKEINRILLACRYTKGCYEYDIETEELNQILPIEA